MISWEIAMFWTAVVLYAASTVLFVTSFVFDKPGWEKWALGLAGVGLAPHSVANFLRWIAAGHAPYLSFYEVTLSLTWFAVLIFLLTQWRYPKMRAIGLVVLPVSFLLLAGAILASKEIILLPPTFRTIWLSIHISFNKLALSCFILGAGAAILYILKERSERKGRVKNFYKQLPDLADLDELSYRFNAAGFIFFGITIIAGAIWANNAWGRYWAWDPIETWSLIAWLTYALYLHLRLQRGWRGGKVAVVAFLAIIAAFIAVYGVPLVTKTIHSLFMAR